MIVIDAGHGGTDSGAVGNGILEKDYTLLISKYLYDRFNELGIPVKMTRDTDITLSPTERVNRILNSFGNSKDVLVISNHLNAGGAEGAEVIYALRNNDTLSKNILNELTMAGQSVRKAYQRRLPSDNTKDYYFIHRNTGLVEPIIVEYGFIDNAKDAQKIRNNYKKYAEAVVKAVANTKGYEYSEPSLSDRYLVKRGDTLWSIAKKLDTSVDELKRANNLSNNLLYINQELIVPNYIKTEDSNISYVVKKGDTLWSISREYGISVDDIKEINNITSDFIVPGTILNIPSSNQIVTDDEESVITSGVIYEVKRGDTLYSISRKYDVPVDDIINENNLSSSVLTVGTKLLIPSRITNVETYIVKQGDSLWSISKKYGVSIDDIKNLNNLNSDVLAVGSEIKIKRNI